MTVETISERGAGKGRTTVVVETCVVCGGHAGGVDSLVVVQRRTRYSVCSDACLRKTVAATWRRRVRARWRLLAICGGALALLLVGRATWRRYRLPERHAISAVPPEPLPPPPPPEPVYYGPEWPPTDEQWAGLFDQAQGVFPLPGPQRRALAIDAHVFGPPAPREHPALCRLAGPCGVDLGGDLWGEHVYAALDGVVEHVRGTGGEDQGGGWVRLVHFGGMVYTQYFHLAAVPRHLTRGSHVRAGDVIGLVGDTGTNGGSPHLTFTLSVRPSSAFSEVYWDPRPWMERWAIHTPPHGTVAGLVPRPAHAERERGRRSGAR